MSNAELFFRSELDNSKFSRAMREMSEQTGRFGKEFQETLRNGHSRASAFFSAIGGAAIAGGLATAFGQVSQYVDNIVDLSGALGLTTEQYQRFSGVFAQSGVDAGGFSKAITSLNGKLEDARAGNATAIESFSKLGISIRELEGKTPVDVLLRISDALAGASDRGKAMAAVLDLVGVRQLKLAGALAQGSEAIQDQAAKVKVASQQSIDAIDRIGDAITVTKNSYLAFATETAGTLLPGAAEAIKGVRNLGAEIFGAIPGAKALSAAVSEVFGLMRDGSGGAPGGFSAMVPGLGRTPTTPTGGLSDQAKGTEAAVNAFNAERAWADAISNQQKATSLSEQFQQITERTARIRRDMFADSLDAEEKILFLEKEKAAVVKDLAKASGIERASLREKLALKDSEIAKEKQLLAARQRAERVAKITEEIASHKSKLSDLGDAQLEYELMSNDERRAFRRESKRVDRARDRLKDVAESRRERGGRDTRPGAEATSKQLDFSEASLQNLARLLAEANAKLIPQQ
jgi:hypothetical protein